jgi:hypothetical protein
MAEERNLAMVRASGAADDESVTKEELQRRMEETRESITQTVAEIKDTVANQYQAVKETVTEALDWREQYRKRPIVFSVGALSVGFIVGYSLAGAFVGEEDDEYADSERRRATSPAASYYRSEGAEGARPAAARSYAAQAITGGSYGSADYDTTSQHETAATPSAYSPAPYSGASAGAEAEEPKGPGLIERFKSTKAYDRLEEEVSALGDRFLDELSKTAQTVVLPLLFSKIKELVGIDLSNKESDARTSQRTSGASGAGGGAQTSAQGGVTGSNRSADESTQSGHEIGNKSTGGSGSSYATSENRGYGASAGGGSRE